MPTDLQVLADTIRMGTFEAIANAGGGHFGGSLSETDILTALYFEELRVDPKRPDWPDRDRFVLSKGHGGPGLYVTLAERGFFPKEWLTELDQDGSRLPKHIDRTKLPGIDFSSGPLGQGLSVAVGMALAARLDGKDLRIYVLIGDGESSEGQIWEAAMAASKYRLDNLLAIIDRNFAQVDGTSDTIMPLEPFAAKWNAFGWNTLSVDGHNIEELLRGFKVAMATKGKPTVIIAKTVKGKGVSFMEGHYEWHSGSVTKEQIQIGRADLEKRLAK